MLEGGAAKCCHILMKGESHKFLVFGEEIIIKSFGRIESVLRSW